MCLKMSDLPHLPISIKEMVKSGNLRMIKLKEPFTEGEKAGIYALYLNDTIYLFDDQGLVVSNFSVNDANKFEGEPVFFKDMSSNGDK